MLGAPLNVGDRLTVLGFFSVNLKCALDALSTTANAPGTAWTVKDALEFFVFGKTTKTAVARRGELLTGPSARTSQC